MRSLNKNFKIFFCISSLCLLFFLSNNKAKAQCSGGYMCGNKVTSCTCSDPNYTGVCTDNQQCGSGICSCTTDCQSTDIVRSCSGFNQTDCNPNFAGPCGSGPNCLASSGCSWTSTPPPPSCTSDGNCLPSGGSCCSGNSYSNGACGSGIMCGTIGATSPPATNPPATNPPGGCYRCHPGAAFCESYTPSGSCDTNCNACPASTPTPTPPSGTSNCGGVCVVNSDCKQYDNGRIAQCCYTNKTTGKLDCTIDFGDPNHVFPAYCVNPICPNNTISGTQCACNGGILCGNPCAGGCINNSTCRYIDGPNCNPGSTYCVPVPLPAGWTTSNCVARDQGNSYVLDNGQNPTVTQLLIACLPPPPFWQTVGGDVLSSGNILSSVPAGTNFMLDSSGGTPGNIIYGLSLSTAPGTTSSKKWSAKTPSYGKKYDSVYFTKIAQAGEQAIIENTIGGGNLSQSDIDNARKSLDGYTYFTSTGNIGTSGNLKINGSERVVLFVNGDFNINGNINLNKKGTNFFLAIVSGGINVNPSVTSASGPALEGIYETDVNFDTGGGTASLYVRGSIVAWGQVILGRNTGTTTSSETFEYGPDLILLFPRSLTQDGLDWTEVAP